MPERTFAIYEVSGKFISDGTDTKVLRVASMTVKDDDNLLNATAASDSGTPQVITTSLGNPSTYRFVFDDTIRFRNGTGPFANETVKTFQMTIDGTQRSFVMNDTGSDIAGFKLGSTINLQSYQAYTPIKYADIPCFVAGTMISTPGGRRAVETLEAGDLVLTRDHGPQPVCWTGRAILDGRALMARPELRPIRIAADAFGPSRPDADLLLSPQHRVLVEGWEVDLTQGVAEALAPAKHLVGDSVMVDPSPDGVTYHHLMFATHEIIEANGLATESLLDRRDDPRRTRRGADRRDLRALSRSRGRHAAGLRAPDPESPRGRGARPPGLPRRHALNRKCSTSPSRTS